MKLSDFQQVTDATIESEFQGVNITLKYICREEFRKRYRASEKTIFVNHQKTKDITENSVFENFKDVVIDWDMTLEQFTNLTGLENPNADPKDLVPCNDEFIEAVWHKAIGFTPFVMDTILEYQNVKKK